MYKYLTSLKFLAGILKVRNMLGIHGASVGVWLDFICMINMKSKPVDATKNLRI